MDRGYEYEYLTSIFWVYLGWDGNIICCGAPNASEPGGATGQGAISNPVRKKFPILSGRLYRCDKVCYARDGSPAFLLSRWADSFVKPLLNLVSI